jgi:hypothetical protein
LCEAVGASQLTEHWGPKDWEDCVATFKKK